MKKGGFINTYTKGLLGIILALSAVMGASAQSLDFIAGSEKMEASSKEKEVTLSWHDEEKEKIHFEEISLDIEEVATVTFINKWGEVVAVLEGDKSVLDDIYRESISKSYFLSAYGVHEVYLLR